MLRVIDEDGSLLRLTLGYGGCNATFRHVDASILIGVSCSLGHQSIHHVRC